MEINYQKFHCISKTVINLDSLLKQTNNNINTYFLFKQLFNKSNSKKLSLYIFFNNDDDDYEGTEIIFSKKHL